MDCGRASSIAPSAGQDHSNRRFPTVEKVIARYIRDCLKSGMPFYISPVLNSDYMSDMVPHADDIYKAIGEVPPEVDDLAAGMGQFEFIPAILSAIGSAASAVGSTIVAIAPSAAAVAGSVAAIKTINAVNGRMASNGQNIAVPAGLAPQVMAATQTDMIGGLSLNTIMLLGAGALLLLVVARR